MSCEIGISAISADVVAFRVVATGGAGVRGAPPAKEEEKKGKSLPPLPPHLRALADRSSQEVLLRSLERLSPAETAQLEARYKKTPHYIEGNRPYVPLWRCLAAAFLEPLLLLLREHIKRDASTEDARMLCDLFWESAVALPLMPTIAVEAMAAQQKEPLVLKAQLTATDGAPAHSDVVKLVLALVPRVALANWRCALHS